MPFRLSSTNFRNCTLTFQRGRCTLRDMSKNTSLPKPLHEMSFEDLTAIWKAARREHFMRLSASGMTYEQIGATYQITRQAVGAVIKPPKLRLAPPADPA